MALKDRLKEARLRLDLTLDEVAQEVGVSRQTIQRYESGVISNIPSDNIEKLAKALKTTPAELMGWSDHSSKEITHSSRGNNFREQIFHQYYACRPQAVQEEIIRRLRDMDSTFSENVSRLLQESGGVDPFIEQTGIPFTVVGQLMHGEPTTITSAEAEKVAKYFNVDVVSLFFNKEVTSTPNLEYTETGKILYKYLKSLFLKKLIDEDTMRKCQKLLIDPDVDRDIQKLMTMIHGKEGWDHQYNRRLYEAITQLLAKNPTIFYNSYINNGNPGLICLMNDLKKII